MVSRLSGAVLPGAMADAGHCGEAAMNLTPEQLHNAEKLLLMFDTMDALSGKTNAELADLLIEHVWAEIPITSPVSALLSEIADRLKGETE
jgi:hypothetical protein